MAHWHNFNPWAATCIYVPSIAEALDLDYEDFVFKEYGRKVDAYILKSPSGFHSFGIRYGKEGHEYLSPQINPQRAEELLRKYEV